MPPAGNLAADSRCRGLVRRAGAWPAICNGLRPVSTVVRRFITRAVCTSCAAALFACASESPKPIATATASTQAVGQTWDLCEWLGPGVDRPGLYGSDLGYPVPLPSQSGAPDQLQLLFGDTWAQATDACQYPLTKTDDFAARIPAQRPASLRAGPPMAATDACNSLSYSLDDASDPTSWRRIRLFPDAGPRTEDRVIDMGILRTPVAAWSDGTHTFAMFVRVEYSHCQTSAECPGGMTCTLDAAYSGKRIGGCQPKLSLSSDAAPDLCRDDGDCTMPALCADLPHGTCVSAQPFSVQRDGQTISPPWYADDPRRGVASVMYIASAFWPERPEDFATGFRFKTNKFMNVTASTVAHFDPQHPENNDYRPGNETLLLWGRPAFTAGGGFQALPFLLYQPLAGMIDERGNIAWNPRYFAGYDAAGDPTWSSSEAEAQPLYGVEENLVQADGRWTWNWTQPEFDYVNQMSVTWVPPLQQWLMLYGGETPATSDRNGNRPPPTYAQRSPGAIHLRAARHPFGRARANSPAAEAYSQARPILTRAAMKDQLACDDDAQHSMDCSRELQSKPGNLLDALSSAVSQASPADLLEASAKCVAGAALLDTKNSAGNDSAGRLYGAAIIDAWTEYLPGADPGVEFYWNVSTWNPYQVRLVKTQLRASELARAQ